MIFILQNFNIYKINKDFLKKKIKKNNKIYKEN